MKTETRTPTPTEPPAVSINLDEIISVGKWKRQRPALEAIIAGRVPKKSYGRNEVIIIYRATDGRIGTMSTFNNLKTVEQLKGYLKQHEQ